MLTLLVGLRWFCGEVRRRSRIRGEVEAFRVEITRHETCEHCAYCCNCPPCRRDRMRLGIGR